MTAESKPASGETKVKETARVPSKASKRLYVKASCARCGIQVACWSIPPPPAGSPQAEDGNVDDMNLFPSKFTSTWLGPEYTLIFPDFDKAKRFLSKAEELSMKDNAVDALGKPINLTHALICPSCKFLLASSPKSEFIDLKERLCLYRSSLKLGLVDMSDMYKVDNGDCPRTVTHHYELPLVNTKDVLSSAIQMSAEAFGNPPLTVMLIGQFWCPYSVHAAQLFSDFCRRQNEDKSTAKLANILVLDTFATGGGSLDLIPDNLQEIVRTLPIPSFLIWYRGHRVQVEEASQHFHCLNGAVIGLDLARYVDITLPRVVSECRTVIESVSSNSTGEKQILTIKL
mmetsp:Transcript_20648/g.25541  ORF Transcript_20648/g.25541 Transcript_20648/m.25541 type:complete len:343 (-) Transcript_20648:373-1401(-)|eukprot:CAMPEP_0172502402 /NCGR_PEP_ID=MMETSP1066-20121228/159632_1 /TAXON_ID=671091 /ORGANISM="Coscinodiscus wailesii, Strain CCMP2513" /LENGTH=342 /DNA_ID=CAMNT_0013277641 /DNA_START=41 /DNA_END=1069 /DNA_ORIENTATION=+